MKFYADEFFKREWQSKNPFDEVEKLDGEIFRQIKNRRTLKFSLGGKNWFLKHHRGVGWREIFKNLLSFKLPVLGASNEFEAIRKLGELEIDSMHCGAYGSRNLNFAKRDSFIITAEIEDAVSLEDVAKKPIAFALKKAIIERIAKVSRTLHNNGINHCDYYICHFLMTGNQTDFKLHLIDLHRVRIRRKVPAHYLFKDMGGIWFSAMDAKLSRRDCLRFIAAYSGHSWREELCRNREFWRKINSVAERLYVREFNREPNHCFVKNGK